MVTAASGHNVKLDPAVVLGCLAMHVRGFRVRMVLLIAAALLPAGCSDSHEPTALPADSPPVTSATPKPTPPPTVTATPKPTKRTRPTKTSKPTKAATGTIEQHLHATTKAFYAAVTKSMKTLDSKAVKKVSDPACEACARYEESAREIKSHGDHYAVVGHYEIRDFRVPAGARRADQIRYATFTLQHTGARLVARNGTLVHRYPPFTESRLMTFRLEEGEWKVLREAAQ